MPSLAYQQALALSREIRPLLDAIPRAAAVGYNRARQHVYAAGGKSADNTSGVEYGAMTAYARRYLALPAPVPSIREWCERWGLTRASFESSLSVERRLLADSRAHARRQRVEEAAAYFLQSQPQHDAEAVRRFARAHRIRPLEFTMALRRHVVLTRAYAHIDAAQPQRLTA